MANRGGDNMESYDRFENEGGNGGTFVMGLLAGTVLGEPRHAVRPEGGIRAAQPAV